jgi:aryl-alcohol dehydrogenase-like predicted oxidoreductase
MILPTHPLGRTGLQITRLGFGSWAVGGGAWAFGWGRQDDAESLAMMRRALDLGVNWPDDSGTPVEDSWGAIMELSHEGKVRAIGVSNFDVPLLARCEAIRHVDSLQPPFSLINRASADREISWGAAGRQIGAGIGPATAPAVRHEVAR